MSYEYFKNLIENKDYHAKYIKSWHDENCNMPNNKSIKSALEILNILNDNKKLPHKILLDVIGGFCFQWYGNNISIYINIDNALDDCAAYLFKRDQNLSLNEDASGNWQIDIREPKDIRNHIFTIQEMLDRTWRKPTKN